MNLLSPLNVADKDLDRVQERVSDAFSKVSRLFVDTTHIISVQLNNATDTVVYHGLSKPPRGWIVCWANAAASIYEGAQSTSYSTSVNLRASATVTVSLLFF